MLLRDKSALFLAMIGLAAMSGSAVAQTLPSPGSFANPQTGHPDEYDVPQAPRGAAAPYAGRPYYPSNRAYPGQDGAAPRYDTRQDYSRQGGATGSVEPYPEPNIVSRPPGFGAAQPSYSGAPETYTARPEQPTVMRPPAPVDPAYAAPAQAAPGQPTSIAALPPEDQPEEGDPKELPAQFRRQVVNYQTKEPAGTIVIDTPSTFLYFVNGDGTAIRYGIGVGRDGFTWAGTERVTRMAEWPDWHPPAEMIERQPYLPRFMAGGPSNPMGARALYLGKTVYRVHGTNQPSTIGQFVSSGCIRMLNEDVEDLYTRVKVGTKVVVLSGARGPSASNASVTR
jgi:lipoprotein-anchoring transpeptidase ErfK/SrfK